MASFAEKLRDVREKRGLSQYALAQRAGLSKQTLSVLELGQSEPSWETVQKLALALDVDCRSFADEAMELPPEVAPGKPGRPPKQRDDAKKPTVSAGKKKRG